MTSYPHPSAPRNNPIEHLYFLIFDQDSNHIRLFTHAFAHLQPAAHWLQPLFELPHTKACWTTPNLITVTHANGYSLVIKGKYLEDIAELKLDKSYNIPYPDNIALEHIKRFHIHSTSEETEIKTTTPKPVSFKANERHKSQKAPSLENHITVAQIAAEIGITSNRARQILRRSKIEKPKHGWSFERTDPLVETITTLLENNK